jgi:hypothetical protein
LRAHEQEFAAKDAKIAAIGLGDAQYARFFREDAGITFPLLIDEKREAYAAAGLKSGSLWHIFRSFNFARRKEARAAGFRQRRTGKNPFQLGGSFIFGPGNLDRFAHLSETFGDNAPVSALLAVLP